MLHRYAPHARHHFFNPYPPVPPTPPFSIHPSILSAAKSGKWLEQARQVMATAEQMRPLIDQYGPLVKNLPSMWKLYRAVQAMPDPDAPEEKIEAHEEKPLEKSFPKKAALKTSESVPWFPNQYR